MFVVRGTSRTSQALVRLSQRTCFIPLYGKCQITPSEQRAVPTGVTPLVRDPHRKNERWTSASDISPVDPRDFPQEASMQETRLLELSRQNRWKEVMFVLQEKGGLQFSSVHIARQVAKSFSRVGRGEDVEAILSFAPAEENAYLDVLFEAYVMQGDVQKAQEYFDRIQQAQVATPPALDQKFLKLLTQQVGVEGMIDTAKKAHAKPSMELHDHNVENLLRDGKLALAEEYLTFIRSLGDEPDARLLNKFIVYHVMEGQLQQAEDLLMSMKPPVRPNLDSFHRLIVTHALERNGEKVDYLLWRIGRRQLMIDRPLYADLLQAFAFTGEHKRVEKTLYRMRKEKLEPELDAFNAILRGYAEAGDFKHVNLTFDELRFKQFDDDQEVPTTPGQFLRPTAETYHGIFRGYDMNGLHQHSVEIYRFMRGRHVEPLEESLPLIRKALEACRSELPDSVAEHDDVIGRSERLSEVFVDRVSHQHKFRKLYDVEM